MEDTRENEIEIIDTDEYYSEKEQEFSHQILVMMAMKKVLEFGCQELIPGYYNTEVDMRGRTKIVYKQDTRKAFIESVRTLKMVMICDFDDDAKKKLIPNKKDKLNPDENLMDKLETRKQFWLKQQDNWWKSLTAGQQANLTKNDLHVMEGYFNMKLEFYQQYFLEELEIYREIFEELTLLTKSLDFYAAQHYGG